MRFKKVVIVGVGLIGGSIGKALIKARAAGEIAGVFRRSSTLKKALKGKAVTRGYLNDYHSALKGADLVVVATPVDGMDRVFRAIAEHAPSPLVVTDAGSVKGSVVRWAGKYKKSFSFVGSHPIAGSEKTGVESSAAGLFKGSVCVVTKVKGMDSRHLRVVTEMWKAVGATVVTMSPREHDEIFAAVSHLPHAVSFSLVGATSEKHIKFAASGFRDTTRVASSDPELWAGILINNKTEVLKGLEKYKKVLGSIENDLKRSDIKKLKARLKRFKEVRDDVFEKN
jgi:prephenate dehydrogenase